MAAHWQTRLRVYVNGEYVGMAIKAAFSPGPVGMGNIQADEPQIDLTFPEGQAPVLPSDRDLYEVEIARLRQREKELVSRLEMVESLNEATLAPHRSDERNLALALWQGDFAAVWPLIDMIADNHDRASVGEKEHKTIAKQKKLIGVQVSRLDRIRAELEVVHHLIVGIIDPGPVCTRVRDLLYEAIASDDEDREIQETLKEPEA